MRLPTFMTNCNGLDVVLDHVQIVRRSAACVRSIALLLFAQWGLWCSCEQNSTLFRNSRGLTKISAWIFAQFKAQTCQLNYFFWLDVDRFGFQCMGLLLRFDIRKPLRSSTWMNTASNREDIPNNYHVKSFLSTCLWIEKNRNVWGKNGKWR
jgi:hypothetical protein